VVARGNGEVRLEVRDRGPGIPRDEQARIFERFFRGRDARSRPVRGSGIGLSLVKSIARAHGGSVEVQSTPGEGSTFIVHVPTGEAA
jgi:signal transduction histidine kinase